MANGFVGGGWYMKLRNPFKPKTVKIRPSKYLAVMDATFIRRLLSPLKI
jgi:hypothetical protein